MPITISDVANEAGVSKSTVSKVLNNWTTISPATVEKVNNAIKKLNYIPNQRAVSFARQTTQNIVYLTNLAKDSAYANPHMFDIMCGVHFELSKENYTLTLVDTSDEEYPGQKAMQEINRRSADGLIIHGSAINEELASIIIKENIPHIIIGHPTFETRLCWIDTDHTLGGEYAADHMISCGYSDVMFIGGKKADEISSQRLKGFRKAMLNHKVHIPQERILYTNSNRHEAYETIFQNIQNNIDFLPQAIICENNLLALSTVNVLKELNLRIPEDIAVLTFNKYPYADIIDPALTIIDINVYDMGIQAGNMMVRKLENPNLLIQSFTALPQLIQGDSTVPQD